MDRPKIDEQNGRALQPKETTMSDDLKNRGPADRSRVNVNEDWERRYWCKEFGCTEQQLRDAVKAVGVMADKVRSHLRGGR
jgi:hypothetical protein